METGKEYYCDAVKRAQANADKFNRPYIVRTYLGKHYVERAPAIPGPLDTVSAPILPKTNGTV